VLVQLHQLLEALLADAQLRGQASILSASDLTERCISILARAKTRDNQRNKASERDY
jgi:hypothetical protein